MKHILRFTGSKKLLAGEAVFKESAKKVGDVDIDMLYYGDYFYDIDWNFKNIHSGEKLKNYDYFRIGGQKGLPFKKALIYYFGHLLKKKLIDPKTLYNLDHSKLSQLLFLNYYNIPTPKSIFFMKNEENIEVHIKLVTERFTYPLVLKDPLLNKGKGVCLIKDKKGLKDYLSNAEDGACILIQEFIENNWDYRVIATKKGVVLSVKRYNKQDFRNNASLGGEVEKVDQLPKSIEEVSQKILEGYGLDVSGIDFFIEDEQFLVIEINSFPDYKPFEEATGISYTEAVLEYIKTL